ncbi:hypothetical protein [Neosynechococcus sphagnicola]|nr:hypothetical protein [Neosynechococcus sphagnicola]
MSKCKIHRIAAMDAEDFKVNFGDRGALSKVLIADATVCRGGDNAHP